MADGFSILIEKNPHYIQCFGRRGGLEGCGQYRIRICDLYNVNVAL